MTSRYILYVSIRIFQKGSSFDPQCVLTFSMRHDANLHTLQQESDLDVSLPQF